MPEYSYQCPKTLRIISVYQGMNDDHLFFGDDGIEWKRLFDKQSMKVVYTEFLKENKSNPDFFPPKAILVFEKL